MASQELEIWAERSSWLDTIHDLGMGIECVCRSTIQDIQLNAAMKAYVNDEASIKLRYLDIFHNDPVEELRSLLQQPLYVTVRGNVLFGAEYRKDQKKELLEKLNNQRNNNVKNNISYSEQLEKEFVGELDALRVSINELASGKYDSAEDSIEIFGYVTLIEPLEHWSHYSGKENDFTGLMEFYNSEYNKSIPYTNISARMFAKIMTDPQTIKSGDPMDIEHASSILPYANLFITDKHWSSFLNRKRIGELYNTQVCYIGDSSEINKYFSEL
ncbi:MAG: hypothetical protein WBS20_13220 [Lysobacterales bacterium]